MDLRFGELFDSQLAGGLQECILISSTKRLPEPLDVFILIQKFYVLVSPCFVVTNGLMNEMCYCGVTVTKGVDSGFSCVAVPEPHAVKFTSTVVCVTYVVIYLGFLADMLLYKESIYSTFALHFLFTISALQPFPRLITAIPLC